MSAPVNLNRFRKQKEREARKAKADANAVRFGRSKAERETAQMLEEKGVRDHDGHKRDR